MSTSIRLTIRLFGAFRKFHAAPVQIDVDSGSTVAEVKSTLGEALTRLHPGFNDLELLNKSVLANDQKILSPEEHLMNDAQLAILPPVCGG